MFEVIIATTTRYESVDELRCQLALRMLQEARAQEIEVHIIDGSTKGSVWQTLLYTGALITHEQAGWSMGHGRRKALLGAATYRKATRVIAWMEPEKYPLVRFLRQLAQPILDDEADMVIPARTPAGFESYPQLQMYAEQCGNEAFKLVTGLAVDAWMGPRFMNHTALRYFADYQGEYGDRWDSIFIPVVRAHAAGLRIISMEVDYIHPPEQTAAEEGTIALGINKRLDQLVSLIDAVSKEAERLGLPKK